VQSVDSAAQSPDRANRSSAHNTSTVNTFKARLDKFWSHKVVKYDFTADLTGTGNRSGLVIIIDFPNLGLTYNGGWCLAT